MADHRESDDIETEGEDAPGAEDAERSEEKILDEARARLELAVDAETEIRRMALEDLEFRAGKQWPEMIERERMSEGRPCLVINRLPQFIQQVTNDQRQNRPSIKVHPVDDQADVETAKVIQGLIRHIEYNSNAEAAYDTAFESAAVGGFGYFRIVTAFVGPDSFDQDILIKRIRNPFSVFFDPYAQEPDGSDASWAFIVDDLSAEEFRAKYPDSKLAQPDADWNAIGNDQAPWIKPDSVRVAEYFYKEEREETLYLLSTGETVREKDLETRLKAAAQAGLPISVVRTRQTKTPVIRWLKINGVEVLEETEWLGSYIPIVPVYGAELFINGRRVLESVIRNAKDAQRMYNYWKSAETEAIALAPRAPFVGAEGQFEGHEHEWASANRTNHPYLEYKPTTIAGQPVGAPQRQAIEPAVQAITQAAMYAAEDLKATTGIYDAAMGAKSNETSGIGIQRRANQAQTSTFHFIDNLTRSLRHTGRILVELIPLIYDTARAARIVGEEGDQQVVKLNQPTGELGPDGKPRIYQLDTGRYDVTVATGPSFTSKRQEAVASMLEASRAVPQLMQIAGDLMIKNMDWPGASEIAERLKKTLPPGLADDGKKQPIPPQVQAQLAQMQMLIKNLSDNLNEATKVIETKQLDLEHRERIEILKLKTDAEIQMAKMGSNESMALLKAQLTEMEHRLSFLQMNQPIEAESNFDPETADGGNYAGIGHIGGTANLTGEDSPGLPREGN